MRSRSFSNFQLRLTHCRLFHLQYSTLNTDAKHPQFNGVALAERGWNRPRSVSVGGSPFIFMKKTQKPFVKTMLANSLFDRVVSISSSYARGE